MRVRHVVLLSLQGAERLRIIPHAALETWLRGSSHGEYSESRSCEWSTATRIHGAVRPSATSRSSVTLAHHVSRRADSGWAKTFCPSCM